MKTTAALLLSTALFMVAAGCASDEPTATPDIQATVDAAVRQALAGTPTPTPRPTRDAPALPTPNASLGTTPSAPDPASGALTSERAIGLVEGRLGELIDDLPNADSRDFFRMALEVELQAVCPDDRSGTRVTGECVVFGPGIAQADLGMEPASGGIWYVWLRDGDVGVATSAPAGSETTPDVESNDGAGLLEAALATRDDQLGELPSRCDGVTKLDGLSAEAGALFADLFQSFDQEVNRTIGGQIAVYELFRQQFQALALRIPDAPTYREAPWGGALERYLASMDNALATLYAGGVGTQLLVRASEGLREVQAFRDEFAVYVSRCARWMGGELAT